MFSLKDFNQVYPSGKKTPYLKENNPLTARGRFYWSLFGLMDVISRRCRVADSSLKLETSTSVSLKIDFSSEAENETKSVVGQDK